jgi:hypothetical protein
MPSKPELERFPSTRLAMLCQQVSDSPEKYTEAGAAEAVEAKLEWLDLQRSSAVSLKEQEEVERKQAGLKKRMVTFLAGTL